VAELENSIVSGASRQLEIRAVATPAVAGQPRILQDNTPLTRDLGERRMVIWAETGDGATQYPKKHFASWGSDTTGDGSETNPYRLPGKAAAEAANSMTDPLQGGWRAIGLDAQEVDLSLPGTFGKFDALKRWGTIEGHESLPRSAIKIVSMTQGGLKTALTRFHNLTFRVPFDALATSQDGADTVLWFDGVDIGATTLAGRSAFPQGAVKSITPVPYRVLLTDSKLELVKQAANKVVLIDRCIIRRVEIDCCANTKAIFDTVFENVGEPLVPLPGDPHEDVVQWQQTAEMDNLIYSGLHVTSPYNYQTFFFRYNVAAVNFRNVAIVNCLTNPPTGFDAKSQWLVNAHHLLLMHVSHARRIFLFGDDGDGFARQMKDVLVLGNAMFRINRNNTIANDINFQFHYNLYGSGTNWGGTQNGNQGPEAPDWDPDTLRPIPGTNLIAKVVPWTVPIDLDGLARPFVSGSGFKATRGVYEPQT